MRFASVHIRTRGDDCWSDLDIDLPYVECGVQPCKPCNTVLASGTGHGYLLLTLQQDSGVSACLTYVILFTDQRSQCVYI